MHCHCGQAKQREYELQAINQVIEEHQKAMLGHVASRMGPAGELVCIVVIIGLQFNTSQNAAIQDVYGAPVADLTHLPVCNHDI